MEFMVLLIILLQREGVYGNNSNSPKAYGILGAYKIGVYLSVLMAIIPQDFLTVMLQLLEILNVSGSKHLKIDDPA